MKAFDRIREGLERGDRQPHGPAMALLELVEATLSSCENAGVTGVGQLERCASCIIY